MLIHSVNKFLCFQDARTFLTLYATYQNVFVAHFMDLFHVNIIHYSYKGQMCVAKALLNFSSDDASLNMLRLRKTKFVSARARILVC